MITHEIQAIRKGGDGRKVVELNTFNDSRPQDEAALRMQASLHIEGGREELEEALGAGYDVGDKYDLEGITLKKVEEE